IYRNGNELALSQRVGNELAKQYGLVQAHEVMEEKKRLRQLGKESEPKGLVETTKQDLTKAAALSIDESGCFQQEKYFDELRKLGYSIKEYYKKDTQELRGYGIEKDGVFQNASDLGKEFTLKKLMTMENDKANEEAVNQRFRLEEMRDSLR
ncbi:MAG: hypothetical protein ACKODS_04065, partial [Methylophilaceae bacterium]